MNDTSTVLASLESSKQITDALADEAASSLGALRTALGRVAEVARPEQGWTRIFRIIAKVATSDWVEGELQVDFVEDAGGTNVSFYAVLGVGIRERLFPAHRLAMPIDEFQRALVLTPTLAAPPQAHQGVQRLTLALGKRVRRKPSAIVPPRSTVARTARSLRFSWRSGTGAVEYACESRVAPHRFRLALATDGNVPRTLDVSR